MNKQAQIRTFDAQSAKYARQLSAHGLDRRWRRRLLASASKRILDLGSGTGANFLYFPADAFVTAIDFSSAMVTHAQDTAAASGFQATLITADIETVDFPPGSFDTVISTLTLCAYDDPADVLRKMNRWCHPEGRILLLEHGRCPFRPFAVLQNWIDPWFMRHLGCHANRDIASLLKNAPFRIERHETRIFGAVHLVWAWPSPV